MESDFRAVKVYEALKSHTKALLIVFVPNKVTLQSTTTLRVFLAEDTSFSTGALEELEIIAALPLDPVPRVTIIEAQLFLLFFRIADPDVWKIISGIQTLPDSIAGTIWAVGARRLALGRVGSGCEQHQKRDCQKLHTKMTKGE